MENNANYFFTFIFKVDGSNEEISVSVNAPDHFKAMALAYSFLVQKGIYDGKHGLRYCSIEVKDAPQEIINQHPTIDFRDHEEYISMMNRLIKMLEGRLKVNGRNFECDSFYKLPPIIEFVHTETEHGKLEVSTSFDFVRTEWVDMVNGVEVARHPRYYLSNFIDEFELADFDAIICDALKFGNTCEFVYERYMEQANKASDRYDLVLLDDIIDRYSKLTGHEVDKATIKRVIASIPDARLRS